MHGSPLLRTVLVLLALLAGGIGLLRLTTRQPPAPPAADTGPPPTAPDGVVSVPFQLILSHPARSIRLDPASGGDALDLTPGAGPHRGRITLDPSHPLIFIDLEWAAAPQPGHHHFAKLTIEPPGQATLTRTFDSTGSLSDVWEIDSQSSLAIGHGVGNPEPVTNDQ